MGPTFNAFCADSAPVATRPKDPRVEEIKSIFSVTIVIVTTIGVAGNVLNLFTLRSPSLQTVPFRYIRALALFDLIGLTVIWLHCILDFLGATRFLPIAYYSVYVEDLLINSFLVAGLYCALLLTVERYLLLRQPHKKRVFNINSVFVKICSMLLVSFLLHCPMVLQVTAKEGAGGRIVKGNNQQMLCREPHWTIYSYYGIFRECIRGLCVVILVSLNFFIARKLQLAKQKRRLLIKRPSSTENPDSVNRSDKNTVMKSFTEKRLTALMVAICFIYVIGNVPQIFVMVFQNESAESRFNFQIFRHIANTFEVLNHCLNFFIFCMASSEYCRAFLTACPCLRSLMERIPCCAAILHSRRFTVTEFHSESRIVSCRRPSTYKRDSQAYNRRNTSTTVVHIVSTASSMTTAAPSSPNRRKSTPSVGFHGVPTVSGALSPHAEDCLVIENAEATFHPKRAIVTVNDFREGDELL